MGFASGDPPFGISALIMFMIYLSAASVCFHLSTRSAQSAVIVRKFSAVEMFAAYSLASVSDSSSPLT